MKKTLLASLGAFCALFAANSASAQEQATVFVDESFPALVSDTDGCKTSYYSPLGANWFIQVGAGIDVPLFENYLPSSKGDARRHVTAAYNLGVGRWFSPYLGFRLSGYYGSMHWDAVSFSRMRYANLNLDFMWDMCNSLGGVNPSRPVSVIPFVGLGGTYSYHTEGAGLNVSAGEGRGVKTHTWTLPVSAGLQLRFRLCKYADFFIEGRASFYGDNFNGMAYHHPIDVNIQAIGGFSINIGGVNFKAYNPCRDAAYIGSLNSQVNALRAELAATAAALAQAEAQLPCPPVQEVQQQETVVMPPVMPSVRFTINSSRISPEEMVNVYNTAQYLKANEGVNVLIQGYADKDTGTAKYNMGLSERRAQAVYDALVNDYGIAPARLSINANGSDVQPYQTNNWNRIVIFVPGF